MGCRNSHNPLVSVGEVVPHQIVTLRVINLVYNKNNLICIRSHLLQKHHILCCYFHAVHHE